MLSCDNLLHFGLNSYNLLYYSGNFLDDFLNVGNDFLYFLNSLVNHNFLNHLFDVLNLDALLFSLYNFLNELRNLDDFLDDLSDGNDFLHHDFNRNSNLFWDNDYLFDFDRSDLLVVVRDDFVHIESLRHLRNDFNGVLDPHLLGYDFLLGVCYGDQFIDYAIDRLLDFNVNIFCHLDLDNSFLDDRNLDLPFDLLDDDFLHYFLNQFLNYLRHFNDLFNDSGNDNNLFDDSFDLNNFGNFDHFLYNFIHINSNLLDSLHISGYFNDPLLNVPDWLWDFDIVIDNFLNFHQFRLIDNHGVPKVDNFDDCVFDSFDDWFLDDFFDNADDLLYHWNFYDLLNLNRNFLYHFNVLLHDDLHWLDDFLPDQFLLYDDHFLDLHSLNNHLHNFLNHLRHLHNSLNGFDDWNNLLHDTVNRLVNGFNVVADFKCLAVLYHGDYPFDDAFNNLYGGHLNNSLHNLLLNHRHLHKFLHNFLHRNNFLLDNLYLLCHMLDVIDDPLNFNHFLHLHNLLHNSWNFNYLYHLLVHIHNPLYDSRNLNHLVDNLLHWNDLFHYLSLNHRNLQRNIHNSLHFHDPLNLNYFLHFLHDWNHHRHLNPSLHDLLNYFFHLHNLRNRSEYFQYIIHIDHSHNLR